MQLDQQSPKQAEPTPEISDISEDIQTIPSRNNQNSKMKNVLEPKRSNRFLIPLIVLALAALGVSAWFVMSRFSNNPAPSPAINAATKKNKPELSAP